MLLPRLRRLSVGIFSALRRGLDAGADWIHARPGLAAWLYRERGAEESYREFNHHYFAHFGEQEKMLADRPRMDFYHAAIARRVRPGARVIDLGTGTGILAAFASRRGAARVYAIDHSSILKHARRLAARNGIRNVEFIDTHSKEFDLRERVDVILHEQMGDFLFDEAMVPNVIDLRERLLKPGGRIVPAVFDFFCEPIKVQDSRRVPFIWELNVHGFDFSSLGRSRPRDNPYYRHASCDLGVIEHFLGRPAPALTFDLHTIEEADLPREIRVTRTVVNAGRLDGFVVFFRTRVDADLSLSSSPLDAGRAPHWGFRTLRVASETFALGDVIELTLSVGDWARPDTWHWHHQLLPAAAAPAKPATPAATAEA